VEQISVSSSYEHPHFKEAQLKIERAGEHMQEFDAYALKVFKGRFAPYCVTSDTDPESGEYIQKYFADSKIVNRFAILCGDIIHNLSAALDYAGLSLLAQTPRRNSSTESNFPYTQPGNILKISSNPEKNKSPSSASAGSSWIRYSRTREGM
jgi:hypothetical protein